MIRQLAQCSYCRACEIALDDRPEQKVDTSKLGPMPMTTSVRLSLMALRGYLILMMLVVLYHVMELAGALATHAH